MNIHVVLWTFAVYAVGVFFMGHGLNVGRRRNVWIGIAMMAVSLVVAVVWKVTA